MLDKCQPFGIDSFISTSSNQQLYLYFDFEAIQLWILIVCLVGTVNRTKNGCQAHLYMRASPNWPLIYKFKSMM